MTTHPGAQYLAELEASAKKATPGEWDVWREPCADKYAAISELTEQVHCTHEFAGAVFLLNANGKCPAETGCGPTSEANAAHIANASPARIAAIAEAFAAEKARADAAEADYAAAFDRGLRAGETLHLEQQATIASLTAKLEACERDRKDRIEQCDRMAADWTDFCASIGITWDTHEAVAAAILRRFHEFTAKLEEAEATATRMQRRAQRAEAYINRVKQDVSEALEPFARWKIADGLPNGMLRTPDQHPILIGTEHMVVAGDFRRARATLDCIKQEEGERE